MVDPKLNSFRIKKIQKTLFRTLTTLSTRKKKWLNTKLRMIAGQFIKVKFMMLLSMLKCILVVAKYSLGKVEIVQNYTINIIHG